MISNIINNIQAISYNDLAQKRFFCREKCRWRAGWRRHEGLDMQRPNGCWLPSAFGWLRKASPWHWSPFQCHINGDRWLRNPFQCHRGAIQCHRNPFQKHRNPFRRQGNPFRRHIIANLWLINAFRSHINAFMTLINVFLTHTKHGNLLKMRELGKTGSKMPLSTHRQAGCVIFTHQDDHACHADTSAHGRSPFPDIRGIG